MALTIPNEASATYSDQAEPDSVDFDALTAGFQRTGVLSGCAVTQRGAGANMSVDVASGVSVVSGASASVAAVNLSIGAANATNPRFDLITVNSAGTVVVTAGTAAANAVFPAIPASSAMLAAVYVPANATSVVTAQIIDKRIIVAPNTPFPLGVAVPPTTGQAFGAPFMKAGGGIAFTAGVLNFIPISVVRTITLAQLAVRVTTADTTGVIRLGLYADSGDYAPNTLIADCGTVSGSTTGNKTVTCTNVLTPGIYWLAGVTQSVTTALNLTQNLLSFTLGGWSLGGYNTNVGDYLPNGGSPMHGYSMTGVTGALPSTTSSLGRIHESGTTGAMRIAAVC